MESQNLIGPSGYLYHWSSKKLIHPKGGSSKPKNDTYIVMHSDMNDRDQRLQFRFVPEEGAGHFGYIEHVSSGMVVHPYGGKLNPANDTRLVLHHDRHAGALFKFDEEDKRIIHKGSGKVVHSNGGAPNPKNDTLLVLHSDLHDAAKFYLGDVYKKVICPYPRPPVISGDWKLVAAILQPNAKHTLTIGITTESRSVNIASTPKPKLSLKISASDILGLCSANAELNYYAEKANEHTWSSTKEEKRVIVVEPGKTVAVWQYVFRIIQYGEETLFYSNITKDTGSLEEKPTSLEDLKIYNVVSLK